MSPSTQPPSSNPNTPPSATPSPDLSTPPSAGPSSSIPAGPVDQAKADLATRLGVSVQEITLVSSAEVTWPDSSLGCPQPGMHYAQVLTNGTRTILTAAGKQYHYHSTPQRPPFLCESPQPPLRPGN